MGSWVQWFMAMLAAIVRPTRRKTSGKPNSELIDDRNRFTAPGSLLAHPLSGAGDAHGQLGLGTKGAIRAIDLTEHGLLLLE